MYGWMDIYELMVSKGLIRNFMSTVKCKITKLFVYTDHIE